MGYWVMAAIARVDSPLSLALLLVASGTLYSSGMLWNDLFDLHVDRLERPTRPLPSGQVGVRSATIIACGLMLVGVLAAAFVNLLAIVVVLILCAAIFLYDGVFKSTPLAPVMMGTCRLLNAALGMTAAWYRLSPDFPPPMFWIPLGNGVYITGVTLFSRQEATNSARSALILAGVVMAMGLGIHARTMAIAGTPTIAWIAGGLFLAAIGYRLVRAVLDPSPVPVQAAVKTFVLGLIVLDAVLVTAFRGPVYGLVVLSLLLPALLLGRWIYST